MHRQPMLTTRRRMAGLGLVVATGLIASPAMAIDYIGPDGGQWHDGENWDSEHGPPDGNFGEDANVSNEDGEDLTVIVSTDPRDDPGLPDFVSRIHLANDGGGTTTLQIEEGGYLADSSWSRIGVSGSEEGWPNELSQIVQTGGTLISGDDDFHLGWRDRFMPGVRYAISGGTFEAADDVMLGQDISNAAGQHRMDLEILGSNIDAFTVGGNLEIFGSTEARAHVHFGIDAGGVTTVEADGRVRWYDQTDDGQAGPPMLSLSLLELQADPANPTGLNELVLFDTGDVWDVPFDADGNPIEDGDTITAIYELNDNEWWEYTWDVSYEPTTRDDGMVLRNLQTTFVPEPSTVGILAMGGLMLLRRRRR